MEILKTVALVFLGAVITTIGSFPNWIRESLQSRKIKDEERNEKLYRPLLLYFTIVESVIKNQAFLLESRLTSESSPSAKFTSDEWLDITGDVADAFGKERLLYTRKVLKVLEENPQYIKSEDWPLVARLFQSHLFKKIISGEQGWKGIAAAFGDKAEKKDGENEFVEVFDELHERVKKQVL